MNCNFPDGLRLIAATALLILDILLESAAAQVNHPPSILRIPNATVDELTLFTFTVQANDPDPGDRLTYYLAQEAPDRMHLNPGTGVLTWTPTGDDADQIYTIGVQVFDSGTPPLMAETSFVLTVPHLNHAPRVVPVADRILDRDLVIICEAMDPDSSDNVPTWEVKESPAGTRVDLNRGCVEWTSLPADIGKTVRFILVAHDAVNPTLLASETVTVHVVREAVLTLLLNPIAHWSPNNPAFGLLSVGSISGGAGVVVATAYDYSPVTGGTSIILTSADGANWQRPVVTSDSIGSSTFAGGLFLLGGQHWSGPGPVGLLLTSPDGLAWRTNRFTAAASIVGATFANGLYLAFAPEGTVFTSKDALTWNDGKVLNSTRRLLDVAGGDGKWVIVAEEEAFVSVNGVDWSRVALPNPATAVAYGGGHFVLCTSDGVFSSADGREWTLTWPRSLEGTPYTVVFTAGRFLALILSLTGSVLLSADGQTWERTDLPPGILFPNVGVASDRFLAIAGGELLTSTDGRSWEGRGDPSGPSLGAMIHVNDQWLAFGDNGRLLVSVDGRHWTPAATTWTNSIRAVTRGTDSLVAVGAEGLIVTSTDGHIWIPRDSGTRASLAGVAQGNGRFVAVGAEWDATPGVLGAIMMTSVDGIGWQRVPLKLDLALGSVRYAAGKFVAVGGNFSPGVGPRGVILTSSDGLTWEEVAKPSQIISDVTYGNARFVAVGGFSYFGHSSGIVMTSPDAKEWSTYRGGYNMAGTSLGSITFVDGWFVAGGYADSRGGATGTVIASRDGLKWNWVFSMPPFRGAINAVYSAEDRVFALGPVGLILESSYRTPPPRQFKLAAEFTQEPADRLWIETSGPGDVVVETSADLLTWIPLRRYSVANGLTVAEFWHSQDEPPRFYRGHWLPDTIPP